MLSDNAILWERYRNLYWEVDGFGLDVSRMIFSERAVNKMRKAINNAFAEMDALEAGAIANKDENRQVGHYWLRNSALAPKGLGRQIDDARARITKFVKAKAGRFDNFLLIGIGGSALGPQFVADALGVQGRGLTPFFFDNTDPDGMDRVMQAIRSTGGGMKKTLVIVVSKGGGTQETRNGMIEAQAVLGRRFPKQAVAITGEGSELEMLAKAGGWLETFPMWDWVGGRTSVTSAVGLLPAALQGVDTDALLRGAARMDELTREKTAMKNPAMLLALMWRFAGGGKGDKAMVVLPYKDRLALFSKYLQQLVMESLGKKKDRNEKVVNQGLTVYGNKGSTDQHAYVQQLRDGRNDFFATFIEVLKDRDGKSPHVGKSQNEQTPSPHDLVTSGDCLGGFLSGTREALFGSGRESITITIPEVDAANVGMLIALFERAVGFYASLINVNAYHQPGVEAGKKAAAAVLALQGKALAHMAANKGAMFDVEGLASAIGQPDDVEALFKILRHLAANGRVSCEHGASPADAKYSM
ncbi:MAG TPA: glucose-6-phosphate isomerase [Candidatus Brocadiia bacterium]|nr:glucose-6-phosphate isomerase [Candidatus Brocadiia bacterium]